MQAFTALPMGRKLVVGAGALLVVDLFLPWQSLSIPFIHVTAHANGWHGWGFATGLATLALLAWTVARARGMALPASIPDGQATLVLAAIVFVCALLKNLIDDYSTLWSYVGVVLAAGVAAGGWLTFRESGEQLPTFGSAAAAPPAASSAPARSGEAPEAPAGLDAT